MAEKLGKWASNRGLISKIRPSDGCKGDTVPSTVVRGYDLCKPGGHLGNVGSGNNCCKNPRSVRSRRRSPRSTGAGRRVGLAPIGALSI